MVDYGSFVPQALKNSPNPLLATLGENLYLDPDVVVQDPYDAIIKKVFQRTHTLLVVYDYLRFTQTKKKITQSTYLMKETVPYTQLSRKEKSWVELRWKNNGLKIGG